ncbi:MAG: trpF [Alphaproteobacteria bacterium]|nr:trpF [Alphaproteobacteria bacterium]
MVEPGGVLGEIVARKRKDVAERLEGQSLDWLRARAEPTRRSLAGALARPGARFIMEMKRTSPSRGASAGHEPDVVARAYADVADAISVLTDTPYFRGSFADLRAVRAMFDGPILCKDFTVDVRQVPEARAQGADAVLVMLSVLDDDEAAACMAEAERFAMGAIVEVHDEAELERALALGAKIIGINNRDLKTLETDLAVTERLAPLVPPGPILIAESGIRSRADVERLAPYADAFLVGSSLMAEDDIAGAARRLAYGRVKVCGLTSPADLDRARCAGASLGGMIFASDSPRNVPEAVAEKIATRAGEQGFPLVGVFRDTPVADIAAAARRFGLVAVQLHGARSGSDIEVLRGSLPQGCEIWTAVGVSEGGDTASGAIGDRPLFDTAVGGRSGGTGQSFDWDAVSARADLAQGLLAGGLGPDNIAAAARLGAWGVDVNSGVENAPGVKSPAKLAALFEALRLPVRQGTGTEAGKNSVQGERRC